MLWVILTCLALGVGIRKQPLRHQILGFAIIGFLIVTTTSWTSAFVFSFRWTVSPTIEAQFFAPTSFPFATVHFADFGSNQFMTRLVLGWPDGLPLRQLRWMAFDADYSRLQRIIISNDLLAINAVSYVLVALCLLLYSRWRITPIEKNIETKSK